MARLGAATAGAMAACAAPAAEPDASPGRAALPSATALPPTATPVPPTPTAPPPTPTPIPEGQVDIQPRAVPQGDTVLIRVWSTQLQSAVATIENRNLTLARDGSALIGLCAFHRVAALGPRPVRFTFVDANGQRTTRNDPADTIRVVDGGYATENIDLPPSSAALLDQREVQKEEALLHGLYGKWTPEKLWHGVFAPPVQGFEISSDFGTRRSYNHGPVTDSHEGLDYAVGLGVPIHVAANGRVVLAQPLHVRGNTVVVDHGWGVMSGYFHMAGIKVAVDQPVGQGDVLGLVGATGFVTGPHLHFEIRVQDVNVQPLEWLGEPHYDRPDLAAL